MSLEYSRPINEIIALRHSVRNYKDEPISKETIEKIESYIQTAENPFGQKVRIQLVHKDESNKDIKLGTYGVIRGANHFLVTDCEANDMSFLALGYTLEKVVLYCTSLGLGTVWLGGTFQKGQFAKAIGLGEQEVLPIVCPVGYEGGKKTMLGTLFGNHSNQRKSFTEVFFDFSTGKPLQIQDAREYANPLEQLRLAPSAVNKQPWRAGIDGGNIHFYLVNEKSLNHVDLGISLAHFHLAALEQGIEGKFVIKDDIKQHKNEQGYVYQISWI